MNPHVGSRFVAVDFHVHTPASLDYKDPAASPRDIIGAALRANLSAVAITDHNSPAWIERVCEAAQGRGVIVFPGFEVNAQGGHIIALFDPSSPLAAIETALIESGIPKPSWGHAEALGHEIQQVLKAIVRNGGLAIAAHADGPKGFLNALQQGAARIRVYKDENLAAIELVDQSRKAEYVEGKVPGYDRPLACIQASDAHALAEVGSRMTWLRMDSLTIEGVRQALSDPSLRIRLAGEEAPAAYPVIGSLRVSKGFLQGQDMPFNPSLNCLVGGAGSGKSTVIEFIRFALDQLSNIEEIADDSYGKLRDLAGVGSVIEVTVILADGGQLLIARTFDDDENPVSVVRLPDREVIEGASLPLLIPIHAYSQGEVIRISRSPLAQLELLDRHLDLTEYQREMQDAYSELESQTPGLVKLEAVTKDRSAINAEIASTMALIKSHTLELQALQQAQKSPVVASHQQWVAERSYITDLLNRMEPTKKAIATAIDEMHIPLKSVPLPSEGTPNYQLLVECRALASAVDSARTDAKNLMMKRLESTEKEIRAKAEIWEAAYQAHDTEYKKLQVEEGSARAQSINSQLETLTKKLHSSRARLEGIGAAQKTLDAQLAKRTELAALVNDRKARIRVLREQKAREFLKEIGDRVSLRLVPDGNRTGYLEGLAELMSGSHAQKPLIAQVCTAIPPTELVALIRKGDVDGIDKGTTVGERWAATIVEKGRAYPEALFHLEASPLEDLLEIGFKVGQADYRPIDKLSTGQKATVIVLLTMVQGTQPILFDQPEDALYTPFIYTDVVRALRREKDQRQFILATHNPNIAVGGDADLGIILEGTASQAEIRTAGGLDHAETQRLMLWHLEGGEDAFRVRKAKFGLK